MNRRGFLGRIGGVIAGALAVKTLPAQKPTVLVTPDQYESAIKILETAHVQDLRHEVEAVEAGYTERVYQIRFRDYGRE